jgi:hypothetical protein
LLNAEDALSTEIGELMAEHFTEGMSALEKVDWENGITGTVSLANSWTNEDWTNIKNGILEDLSNIENNVAAIGTELGAQGISASTAKQYSDLNKASFDMSDLGVTVDEEGNVVSSSGGSLSETQTA